MRGSFFDHVHPPDLPGQALAFGLKQFLGQHHGTQFLVISLPDANGPLAAGLNATASDERVAVQPAVQPLSYNTVLHPAPSEALAHASSSADRALHQLSHRLRRNPHFIAQLRKRAAVRSAFQKRISVGRATNQDIVLRDGSVSKSHAWFELDETGTFHVADAGSTNGTKVEGTAIEPRILSRVEPGTLITFGSIEAMLCDAETLWRTFDAARAEWRPPTK